MAGLVETIGIVARNGQLADAARGGVEHEQVDVVAVFGREIDLAIAPRPVDIADGGVEVLGQRGHTLRGNIIEEQLVFGHARSDIGWQLTAHAVECLGIANEQELLAVGRQTGSAQKLGSGQQRVDLERPGIHQQIVGDGGGTLGESTARRHEQQLRSVRRDVGQILTLVAKGHALTETRGEVETLKMRTRAPAGLTVVHLQHLKHIGIFARPFVGDGEHEVVFGGTDGVAALWQTGSQHRALATTRIDGVEHATASFSLLFYICARTRHPSDVLGETAHQALRLHLAQLIRPLALTASLSGLIREHHKGTVGRERDATHTTAIGQIVYHIGMLRVERIGHTLWSIDCDANGIGVFWLCHILDGHGVVLGSQLQVGSGFGSVDIYLIVLRSFHRQFGLQIAAVVDVESEQTNAFLVVERGQKCILVDLRCSDSLVVERTKKRSIVELLAVHVDGIGGKWSADGKRTTKVELRHCRLLLCRQCQRQHQQAA